jgi:hypothetical protein
MLRRRKTPSVVIRDLSLVINTENPIIPFYPDEGRQGDVEILASKLWPRTYASMSL